jgi:MFS family permease
MNPTISKNPLTENTPSMAVGLTVWGFGAVFYLLGFFHRVAPAVITGELMRDFHISAAALGNLSAFYFYSYVAMQIPTGILADRWGPRRLLTLGALVAAVGAVMFALAPSLACASVGRLLIGGSVAVAFVGLLKLAASWFAPHRFALLSGLALFFGIVGAVFAGPPLRILVDLYGWRTVVLFSALLTLFVGVGTWLFVRDYPHDKGYLDFSTVPSVSGATVESGIIAGVFQVFTYPNTVLLFVIPGGIVGCVLTKESVPTHLAGTVSGVINMGVMIGPMVLQPAVGWVLDRMWTGTMAAGVRVYPVAAYRDGFALMLAWITVSLVLLLFTRETGCRQTVE